MAGWEPSTTIRHEYQDGVLVATVSRPESEWDEFSHALMAVYRDWCLSLCHKCGLPLTDHDGTTAEDWYGGFYTCVGVDALRRDQEKRVKTDGGEKPNARLEPGRSWYIGQFSPEIRAARPPHPTNADLTEVPGG